MTAPTTRETADMSKNPAETNTSAEHVKTSDHSKLQKMQIGPDHAELARLAEALRKPEIWQSYPGPEGDFEIRLAPFDAATGLEALLSEIAALREYGRDVAKEALEYRRQRDELSEALVQADLTIRSIPGTDQSDVEFIHQALADPKKENPT